MYIHKLSNQSYVNQSALLASYLASSLWLEDMISYCEGRELIANATEQRK
jgi:hypothetical protein